MMGIEYNEAYPVDKSVFVLAFSRQNRRKGRAFVLFNLATAYFVLCRNS